MVCINFSKFVFVFSVFRRKVYEKMFNRKYIRPNKRTILERWGYPPKKNLPALLRLINDPNYYGTEEMYCLYDKPEKSNPKTKPRKQKSKVNNQKSKTNELTDATAHAITDPIHCTVNESNKCTVNDLNQGIDMPIAKNDGEAAINSGNGLNKTTNVGANYGDATTTNTQLSVNANAMASLWNIGNTCYMNSALYALRFTPRFLHNLHQLAGDLPQVLTSLENEESVREENSRTSDLAILRSSSSIVYHLHDLFKQLAGSELSKSLQPYKPDALKNVIEAVNPTFKGNGQQDAHELLMCILNSVRESCEILKKYRNG